jgi:hypothetical protein
MVHTRETIGVRIGAVASAQEKDRYAAIVMSASARSRANASGRSVLSCWSSARAGMSRRMRVAEASTPNLTYGLNQAD